MRFDIASKLCVLQNGKRNLCDFDGCVILCDKLTGANTIRYLIVALCLMFLTGSILFIFSLVPLSFISFFCNANVKKAACNFLNEK